LSDWLQSSRQEKEGINEKKKKEKTQMMKKKGIMAPLIDEVRNLREK
jgi:hypothetical protein